MDAQRWADDFWSKHYAKLYTSPENYEQELVDELKIAYVQYHHTNIWGHIYEDVVIEGAYPTSALVITFTEPGTGRRHSHVYRLWGPDGIASPEGSPELPHSLSNLVTMWLEEPLGDDSQFYGEWRWA